SLVSSLMSPVVLLIVIFESCAAHRLLHSFPTRRSSDLARRGGANRPRQHVGEHRAADAGARRRLHRARTSIRNRQGGAHLAAQPDRKSTRLNSSHRTISYAVFCLKKKNEQRYCPTIQMA